MEGWALGRGLVTVLVGVVACMATIVCSPNQPTVAEPGRGGRRGLAGLKGSAGGTADNAQPDPDRPGGLLGYDDCDLFCEISRAGALESTNNRVGRRQNGSQDSQAAAEVGPYPLISLQPYFPATHAYHVAGKKIAKGKCAGAVRDLAPAVKACGDCEGRNALELLFATALACAGRLDQARELLKELDTRGYPGMEREVRSALRRVKPGAGTDLGKDPTPSLARDGGAFLPMALAEARALARQGDVDGAVRRLDLLRGEAGARWQLLSIARTEGEILVAAGRDNEAAVVYYRHWRETRSSKARRAMADKLDALAARGVRAHMPSLGEQLRALRGGFVANKPKTAKRSIDALARRYKLTGKDRQALYALAKGVALEASRDRAAALGVFQQAGRLAKHPALRAQIGYERGTVLRRMDRDREAVDLYLETARAFRSQPVAGECWYQAGRLSGYIGEYGRARQILAELVLLYPNHDRIPDAIWEAAWADWRAGELKGASRLLRYLGRHHGNKVDRSGLPYEARALYWRSRALGEMGRTGEAIDGLRFVMERFPLSYYAVLAHHRIAAMGVEPTAAVPFHPILSAPVTAESLRSLTDASIPGHPRARRALELWKTGRRAEAKAGLGSQLQYAGAPRGVVEVLATFYLLDDDFATSHWIATRHGDFSVAPYEGNARLWGLAHPAPPKFVSIARTVGQDVGVDPALALAIIRHESAFKSSAKSGRGAVGLMQLMKGTARSVNRTWYGGSGPTKRELFKPEVNIRMGMTMFALLDHVFSGNAPMMIAAYNAGPGIAARWHARFRGLPTDAFVEQMTYPFTVAYVKKVIGSWYAYRVLMGEGSPPYVRLSVPQKLEAWEKPGGNLVGIR